jgi:hypothetical protein
VRALAEQTQRRASWGNQSRVPSSAVSSTDMLPLAPVSIVMSTRALRPREAVLAWLAEVQELTDINDYSRHVAEVPIEAAPMSIAARRVDAAVREDMKGKPRDAIEDAVYRATGDALFLFCLVFQVNIEVVQTADVEALRAAAVFLWMGCLLGGPRDEDLAPEELAEHHRELTSSWAAWLSAVDRLDRDVQVMNQMRATLADRYYAGQDVLFANARTRWQGHVEQVDRIKGLADAIGSSSRGKVARRQRTRRPALPTVQAGVEDRMASLIDHAKVRAYEVLGDLPKAVAIMERRILA